MRSTLRFRRALLGHDLDPVTDAWIAVEDGLIVEIGTGSPTASASGDRSEHHPAAFGLPGLVDCHVHLALSGGLDIQAEALAQDPITAERLVRANAARHLDSGVTTVRDLGSPGNVVIELAAREGGRGGAGILDTGSPRIVAAGAIGSATGHGSFLATAAETFDEYLVALDDLAARGVGTAKLFASGGVITSGTEPGAVQMAPELLAAVVRAAHARGIRVATHAHGATSIRNAIAAGADTVEHFSYLGQDELAALRARDVTLISTFVATERFVSSPDRARSNREATAKIIDHAPHERRALEAAVRGGARLAVGTDAGTTLNPHGWGMQEQAVHLVEAGMDPASALRALTIGGADALAVAGGVLAPGMPADVLCLGADPLADIRALSAIDAVMLAGRWVR
ncbi:amidohydrolase family protein [Agromyces aerolatus]|uniref:amidohydrolase family protein n=1 Tax=Agromyces sp. LY-1074 TaxID=3074080 RepID=UPI002867AD94|nr:MULTISPECIES: amidohydrolase family protein [unclassified Agromyces]MDR5699550.1 amidohydrolase family protein [Agromyces sp. LY-1074]MDR5705846.1 amidohydrolase family protein [Agromyces sp. LY-1358]